MKKQSPKQPAKRNAKRPAPVGNGETAQGAPSQAANPSGGNADAAQGTAANCCGGTEQQAIFYAQKYINELRADCDLLKFEIESALYNDGAGLLENEKIRVPLGRIAAIESWIKYFKFTEDMIAAMRDEVTAQGRARVRETARLRERLTGKPERIETFADVPLSEIKQWYQIAYPDSWQIEFFNLSQMAFEEWFNFHVVPVLSLLKKWVEVAADLPQILRDAGAVEKCKCHYIPANTENGGVAELGFNFKWINDFFSVAVLRDGKTDTGAAAARESLHGKPDAAQGAANPSGVFNVSGGIVINTPEPVQVNAPAPAKQKPAEPVTDGETKAGEPVAGHIGTWAKAQGATAYYVGVSVCIRGTVCPLPPVSQKRGRAIAELIENENLFGAVKCDIHSALGGDTSSAEYEKIAGFLERVNKGKRGKKADCKFSGCWHLKPAPVRR